MLCPFRRAGCAKQGWQRIPQDDASRSSRPHLFESELELGLATGPEPGAVEDSVLAAGGGLGMEGTMNRIRRIASRRRQHRCAYTCHAVGAYAGPTVPAWRGWCPSWGLRLTQDQIPLLLRREQQQYMQVPVDEPPPLRQEQQYMQQQRWAYPADEAAPVSDATTGLSPWEAVGLAALGAGVLAGGGVVLVRRYHHEPTQPDCTICGTPGDARPVRRRAPGSPAPPPPLLLPLNSRPRSPLSLALPPLAPL